MSALRRARTSLLAATCSLAMPAWASVDTSPTLDVIGGEDGKMCSWPSLVMMVVNQPTGQKGVCTGTLVHPKLVLYAAHCGSPDQLIFGESLGGATIIKEDGIESYKVNPRWRTVSDLVEDYAYVVLKEPLTKVPTVPVYSGCERAHGDKRGRSIRLAGFSSNDSTDGKQVFLRWGQNRLANLSGGVAMVADAGRSAIACRGDSGGPLLFQLDDGSWRTMGIASTLQGTCGQPDAVNRYTQINDRIVNWVESNSGVDITPCFDASGKPTPSKDCDQHLAYSGNPKSPVGERSEMCVSAPTKPAGNFCEVPKGEDDSTGGDDDTSSGEDDGSSTGDDESSDESSSTGSSTDDSTETDPDDSTSDDATSEPDDSESEEDTSDEGQDTKDDEESGESGESDDNDDDDDANSKEPDAPVRASSSGCAIEGNAPRGSLLVLMLSLCGLRRRRSQLTRAA